MWSMAWTESAALVGVVLPHTSHTYDLWLVTVCLSTAAAVPMNAHCSHLTYLPSECTSRIWRRFALLKDEA